MVPPCVGGNSAHESVQSNRCDLLQAFPETSRPIRRNPHLSIPLHLRYLPAALWLRVRDNGPGPPAELPAGGLGLAGMHERATAVGGQLRTGLALGGGFAVEVTLPAKAETPE